MARRRISRRAGTLADRSSGVMAALVPELPATRSVLVVEDDGGVTAAWRARAARVSTWHRLVGPGRTARAWPEEGRHDAACVRLPRSRAELDMRLHAVAARLGPGAPLWLHGANDEGIRSTARRLAPLFTDVRTLDTRRHCRVLEARRSADGPEPRGRLQDWSETVRVELPPGPGGDGPVALESWPGLFAHGRLDGGSALLAAALTDVPSDALTDVPSDALTDVPSGRAVLDFGCGAGALALAVLRRAPDVRLTLIDADALAVHAARLNVPGADVRLGDGWSALQPGERFALVVSNPAFHAGRAEDFGLLVDLVRGAPERLLPGGGLLVVTLTTAGAGRLVREAFPGARAIRDDGRHAVWLGRRSGQA